MTYIVSGEALNSTHSLRLGLFVTPLPNVPMVIDHLFSQVLWWKSNIVGQRTIFRFQNRLKAIKSLNSQNRGNKQNVGVLNTCIWWLKLNLRRNFDYWGYWRLCKRQLDLHSTISKSCWNTEWLGNLERGVIFDFSFPNALSFHASTSHSVLQPMNIIIFEPKKIKTVR